MFQKIEWKKMILILLIIGIAFHAMPLTAGIIVAYFLSPISLFLTNRLKIPRIFSTLLTLFLFCLIAAASASIFLTLTWLQIKDTIYLLQQGTLLDSPTSNQILSALDRQLILYMEKIQTTIPSILSEIPTKFFEFVLFCFALFFSLYESFRNRYWIFDFFPRKIKKEALFFFQKSTSLLTIFVKIETQLLLVTFVVLSTGFLIIGFHSPLQASSLITLADLIPFIGTGMILFPMIVYFILIDSKMIAIYLTCLYCILIIIRQLLENYLWANSVHTRPIITFFIGAASIIFFGIYGLILSPIFLATYYHFTSNNER
ncbi:AI-2E family transporter [Paenisporosarcina cavernae]|uniref:AI-2E family transporter n=1 Tax=Paenisporosarcina cavernae TaxID=2320858 RepID=UPI0013C44EC1|nr:AI-2E family transporter [Paenisporosarcina cavernae]